MFLHLFVRAACDNPWDFYPYFICHLVVADNASHWGAIPSHPSQRECFHPMSARQSSHQPPDNRQLLQGKNRGKGRSFSSSPFWQLGEGMEVEHQFGSLISKGITVESAPLQWASTAVSSFYHKSGNWRPMISLGTWPRTLGRWDGDLAWTGWWAALKPAPADLLSWHSWMETTASTTCSLSPAPWWLPLILRALSSLYHSPEATGVSPLLFRASPFPLQLGHLRLL